MTNNSAVILVAKYFNNFYLSEASQSTCLGLVVEGVTVGLVKPFVVKELLEFESQDVFKVQEGLKRVEFKEGIKNYDDRSRAVAELLVRLRDRDMFTTLKGWRNECFEIKRDGRYSSGMLDSDSLMEMERSATCLFGMRQFGVDINGYVRHPVLGLCLWLQKRADNKQTWPGKMDNMVGGGLSVGYSVLETALKEASEEAGIGKELLSRSLVACGCVSFFFESERGLFPNTEFVFDLELPVDFIPENQDGEVQSFSLVSVKDALEMVLSPEFKTTSCPVTLDFLVRHGVINASNGKAPWVTPYTSNRRRTIARIWKPELGLLEELLHVPLHSMYNKYNNNKSI